MTFTNHLNCRVCGSENLEPYLDLGFLPLSNNLATSTLDPIHNERYPLQVMLCTNCSLSQLSIVVNPEKLFSHYVYRSSISQGYKDHCKQMAIDLKEKYNLTDESFHIDIAGNDGALLEQFKKVLGHKVLNIDPAENLAGIAEAAGIPTLTMFWDLSTANKVKNAHPKADLITATNVFAHVDNVKEFIQGVKLVLNTKGVLVLEFPYLVDFIDKREFDTVYFEHLSYFSIRPLYYLVKKLGLDIINVEKQEIHGGTVRVTIAHEGAYPINNVVYDYMTDEFANYSDLEVYRKFNEDVQESIIRFRNGVHSFPNKTVAGFAASAKGNTLLNSAFITVGSMKYIVDETPEKIGKYSPGTRIPIVGMDILKRNPPDYLVILSWNFAKEIIEKCTKAGYKGDFIIPIPEFNIIKIGEFETSS